MQHRGAARALRRPRPIRHQISLLPCAGPTRVRRIIQQEKSPGSTYASTPIVASDITFSRELLTAAGCGTDEVKRAQGSDRLAMGCPTHSAFHFYSEGCPDPKDIDAAIAGFKERVRDSKKLNDDFALEGTIVNELGSLKGKSNMTCEPEKMAAMMGGLFDYLETDVGRGVVSQMIWFNQNGTGGTFDLRLVGQNDEVTPLGEKYVQACQKWARANGVSEKTP